VIGRSVELFGHPTHNHVVPAFERVARPRLEHRHGLVAASHHDRAERTKHAGIASRRRRRPDAYGWSELLVGGFEAGGGVHRIAMRRVAELGAQPDVADRYPTGFNPDAGPPKADRSS
jgi:hypothetical protein